MNDTFIFLWPPMFFVLGSNILRYQTIPGDNTLLTHCGNVFKMCSRLKSKSEIWIMSDPMVHDMLDHSTVLQLVRKCLALLQNLSSIIYSPPMWSLLIPLSFVLKWHIVSWNSVINLLYHSNLEWFMEMRKRITALEIWSRDLRKLINPPFNRQTVLNMQDGLVL
jgi:hypothetical protein